MQLRSGRIRAMQKQSLNCTKSTCQQSSELISLSSSQLPLVHSVLALVTQAAKLRSTSAALSANTVASHAKGAVELQSLGTLSFGGIVEACNIIPSITGPFVHCITISLANITLCTRSVPLCFCLLFLVRLLLVDNLLSPTSRVCHLARDCDTPNPENHCTTAALLRNDS